MPIFAITLLILSAVLHTAWNLILKQAQDKYIATWWMLVFGGVFAIIPLFFTGLPPRHMLPFAFLSTFTEAAYFVILSYAYHNNDFSLVYPVARGTAPAFLALWSFLFLREQLTLGGKVGMGMIIGGLIVIGLSGFILSKVPHLHFKGIAIALCIALLISIYTVIDGSAVKRGEALPYVMMMFTLVPLPVTPLVLRQYGWPRIKAVWNRQGFKLPFMGLIGVAAYLMAVSAYSFAPLSYAGAVREVSVVFGAFAGWQFLGEKMGGMRVLGAAIIFGGILMIALYG